MEVLGFCHTCNKQFDAHWHNYPELKGIEAHLNRYCPYCKNTDLHVTTDESNDFESPDDYDDIDMEE